MFINSIHVLKHMTLGDFVDILLVALILYSIFLLLKETRAYQLAMGLILVALLYAVSQWAKLTVSNMLIRNFINYLIIAVIVLFQGEIRRFLTGVGSRSFRRRLTRRSMEEKIEDVSLAVDYLSQKRIGALIAMEREISLRNYADRGTRLDAHLTKELLVNLFHPHAPLHDGAVIIQGSKIIAAGCLLPLPATHNLGKEFVARTRHLAAIGLSEETDAAVIVVSEESGTISVAVKGHLERFQDRDQLKNRLIEYLKNR
jgi:diadenylate cyclase